MKKIKTKKKPGSKLGGVSTTLSRGGSTAASRATLKRKIPISLAIPLSVSPIRASSNNSSNGSYSGLTNTYQAPIQIFTGTIKVSPMPQNSIEDKFWENNYVIDKKYKYIFQNLNRDFKIFFRTKKGFELNFQTEPKTVIKYFYKYLLSNLNNRKSKKQTRAKTKAKSNSEFIQKCCLELYNIGAPKGLGDIGPWIMDYMVVTIGNRLLLIRSNQNVFKIKEEIKYQDEFNNRFVYDEYIQDYLMKRFVKTNSDRVTKKAKTDRLTKNQVDSILLRKAYMNNLDGSLPELDPNKITCLGANDLEPKALLFAGYQLVKNSQGCFMMTKYMGYALIFINEIIIKLLETKPNMTLLDLIETYQLYFRLNSKGILLVYCNIYSEPLRISVACSRIIDDKSIENYNLEHLEKACKIFNLALSVDSMYKIVGMLAIVGSTLTHDIYADIEDKKRMTFELLKMKIFKNLNKLEDVLPFNPIDNKSLFENNPLESSSKFVFILNKTNLSLYKIMSLADIININTIDCTGRVMTIASSVEATNLVIEVAGSGIENRGAFVTQQIFVAEEENNRIFNSGFSHIQGFCMTANSEYLPDCLNWYKNNNDNPKIMLHVPGRNGVEIISKTKLSYRLTQFFGRDVIEYINSFLTNYENTYNDNEKYLELKYLITILDSKYNLDLNPNVVNLIKLIIDYKGNPPEDSVKNIIVPDVEDIKVKYATQATSSENLTELTQ